MLTRSTFSSFLACSIVFLSLIISPESHAQEKNLTHYVNPFLGTAPLNNDTIIGYHPPKDWRVWAGLTFPGTSLPNAMVQLSPITAYHTGSGYQYEDSLIYGFTHTNKGHWNLCNVPVLPVQNVSTESNQFESSFQKPSEQASPGYYAVTLDRYAVRVELTSTLHCGIHRYSFSNNANRAILFDLGKANNDVRGWTITQLNAHSLEGVQNMGREKVFFYATVNAAIEKVEIKEPGKSQGFALVQLQDDATGPVEMRLALSYVSSANARENLEAETKGLDFAAIRSHAVDRWEQLLHRIEVKGGTERQRRLFYSSLYRAFLWPALRSDVNGQYMNEKNQVVKKNFRYYTIPSLWDTYRNKLVLLGLLEPDVTADVISSLIDRGEETGYIPTFFHGDHAASFIAGSYARGIRNFDAKEALRLLLKNANEEGGPRPHIREYIEQGYISEPEIENPKVETVASAGVSKTLEFAYDDYSVAQLAAALGDKATHETFMKRAQNYKNVFDPSSRFMRGRYADGKWVEPFNPQFPYYEYMYREANGWQLSFYVPHDMAGLTKLYGGASGLENKLDSFFSKPWNPNYIARNISGFIGQYCHGNQPDHEAPYAYYFTGKPEKSQHIIDTILNYYYGIGADENALCGMDDAGEMSSWYVFAAMGIYPFSATDPRYIISVPLFDEVKFHAGGKKPLLIRKSGSGSEFRSIMLDGKTLSDFYLSDKSLKTGGTLQISTQ